MNFATYPAGKHADVVVRLEGASGTLATRTVGVDLTGELCRRRRELRARRTAARAGVAARRRGQHRRRAVTAARRASGGAPARARAASRARASPARVDAVAGPRGGSGGAAGTGTGGVAGTGVRRRGRTRRRGRHCGHGRRGRERPRRSQRRWWRAAAARRAGCTPTGPESLLQQPRRRLRRQRRLRGHRLQPRRVVRGAGSDAGAARRRGAGRADALPAQLHHDDDHQPRPGAGPVLGVHLRAAAGELRGPLLRLPVLRPVHARPELADAWWGRSPRRSPAPSPNWHARRQRLRLRRGGGNDDADVPGLHRGRHATMGTPTWTATTRFCATTLRGRRLRRGLRLSARRHQQPAALRDGRRERLLPGRHAAERLVHRLHGELRVQPVLVRSAVGRELRDVRLSVASNSTCDSSSSVAQLASGAHVCASPGGLYRPSIVFTGQPTAPTCLPQNTSSGSLTPTGPQTVCCR